MKKLQLPTVTLVVVETQLHRLASMATWSCLDVADFGDVIIASDNSFEFSFLPARFLKVEDWPTKMAVQKFIYSRFSDFKINTEYALFVEWDAGIVNPDSWTDEFLEYDYLGAPWGYTDGHNVGNGGFSLRSTRLMNYLCDKYSTFPITSSNADTLLCRDYRAQLEARGFKWAPEELAHRFAAERNARPDVAPFGFHGMFNWSQVLDRKELIKRMLIAKEFPYITNDSFMWGALLERNPTLTKELEDAITLDQAGQGYVGDCPRVASQG